MFVRKCVLCQPCSERKFVAIDYVTPNDVAADCGRHGTPLIFAIDATLDMSAMDQMKSNIFEVKDRVAVFVLCSLSESYLQSL